MDPRSRGPDSQLTCQEWVGLWVPFLPLSPGVAGCGEKRVGGTGWETLGGSYVLVLVCIPPGW